MKDTTVIIVNWNGERFLKDCLESLRGQTYKNFKIILVDNGSGDDSVRFVKENFPEIEIIQLEKNTGFAYPNNLGIQKAFVDENIKYIITLNNDTKVDPKYIEEMVSCANSQLAVGSVQPKVINFFEPDIIDSTGILIYFDASAIDRGRKEKDEGQYEKVEEIFGASASAALYVREALEKVKILEDNYFDADYFAYYEDVDLAWRLRLAGYKSFYAPRAMVHHIHSATGKNYSPFKAFHVHRNHYFNILKNLPLKFMPKALLYQPVRYLLLISSLLRKKGPSAKLVENEEKVSVVKIVWRSWKAVIINMPKTIQKRRLIQKNKTVRNGEVASWLKKYQADWRKIIYG